MAVSGALSRDLAHQNDFAGRSRVRPLVQPTGRPSRQRLAPLPADDLAPSAAAALACCEWVNGHQRPARPGGRPKRPSPSAGALYPTELFVRTGGGGEVWHHDPIRRGLRRVQALNGSERSAGTEFLLVSDVWRTAQRYGVRGYRYCLLDAGIMGGHLAAVLAAAGAGPVTASGVPDAPDERHVPGVPAAAVGRSGRALGPGLGLALGPAELPLLRIRCSGEVPALDLPPWAAALSAAASAGPHSGPTQAFAGFPSPLAEAPHLSPVMARIGRMRELAAGRAPAATAWPLGRDLEDVTRYLTQRRSAAAFASAGAGSGSAAGSGEGAGAAAAGSGTGGGAGPDRGDRDSSWDLLETVARRAVARAPWVMTSGLCARVLVRTRIGDGWDRVARACQGQRIVADASALVVFGLLGRPREHGDFERAVLDAGFTVARCYHAAWRARWATTTVGGFDDASLASLTGWPGFQPIVAQAFGRPAEAVGTRSDVVPGPPARRRVPQHQFLQRTSPERKAHP